MEGKGSTVGKIIGVGGRRMGSREDGAGSVIRAEFKAGS
jgi:hypothetical protein